MKAHFLGLLLSCVFLVIGSAIMVYSLYFFEVCAPGPEYEGKLCATGGIGNNTNDAWFEDLDRAGAIFGSGLVIFLSALLTIILIKWKSDISEEPKFAIKLAYASIGLSLISLFFHFFGHNSLHFLGYWPDDAWTPGSITQYTWLSREEIPYVGCYLENVFFFKGWYSLIGIGHISEWPDPYLYCSNHRMSKWHYLDVLSFPIVLGSILIYFYKEDSPDSDMKKIAAKAIIFLVIMKLFLSFLSFLTSDFYMPVWSVKFLFLLEIIFMLFFLVFTVGMIRGVNSNISNFIIPSILLLNVLYVILKIYASVWIDYHSGIIWTSFWANNFVNNNYKMYAILELIIRPLFYYSMACLYVYREENPWY